MNSAGRNRARGRTPKRGRPWLGLLAVLTLNVRCGGHSVQHTNPAAGAAGLAAHGGSGDGAGTAGTSPGIAGAGAQGLPGCATPPPADPACPAGQPEPNSACPVDELNCSFGGDCGSACRCFQGSWHCGTKSCTAGCDYSDPTRCYRGRSPAACEAIDFECTEGLVFFTDECGCGCRTP